MRQFQSKQNDQLDGFEVKHVRIANVYMSIICANSMLNRIILRIINIIVHFMCVQNTMVYYKFIRTKCHMQF